MKMKIDYRTFTDGMSIMQGVPRDARTQAKEYVNMYIPAEYLINITETQFISETLVRGIFNSHIVVTVWFRWPEDEHPPQTE